jgi:hypothetical protein
MYIDTLRLKCEEEKNKNIYENNSKCTNVHFELTQTRTATYNVTDPSSRQGERPMTNKTATVLTTNKISL